MRKVLLNRNVLALSSWGVVAQWLERAADDRVVAGSNPTEAAWKLWQFPLLPVSFGRDTKSRWSLLSGVYARASKRSYTGDKCVTCRELNILPGQ